MKHLLLFGVILTSSFLVADDFETRHARAERDHKTRSMNLATGVRGSWRGKGKLPWPVKVLSIGHTIASYQNYGALSGEPYFHHGLDIRADDGSEVQASSGGKVVNIENYVAGDRRYWEVAILDDDGFLWQYHHIDHDAIPTEIHEAYKTGKKITAGTKIGEVVDWPISTFGEIYHHVHLNILGAGKKYLDPFDFLEALPDVDAPEIVDIGLLKNGEKTSSPISGNYSLYVHARDLILHKKFYVPPQSIWYQIDGQMPILEWEFNTLPGGDSNTKYVHNFFVRSLACGNYKCRKPIFDLGFRLSHGPLFPTSEGHHEVTVRVADHAGNQATRKFEWEVSP